MSQHLLLDACNVMDLSAGLDQFKSVFKTWCLYTVSRMRQKRTVKFDLQMTSPAIYYRGRTGFYSLSEARELRLLETFWSQKHNKSVLGLKKQNKKNS